MNYIGKKVFDIAIAGLVFVVVKLLCVLVQLRNIFKIHVEGLKEKEETAQAGGFFHFNDNLETQDTKYGHMNAADLTTLPPPTVQAATEHLALRPPNEDMIRSTINKSRYNDFRVSYIL